jgi:hypothetical protein
MTSRRDDGLKPGELIGACRAKTSPRPSPKGIHILDALEAETSCGAAPDSGVKYMNALPKGEAVKTAPLPIKPIRLRSNSVGQGRRQN